MNRAGSDQVYRAIADPTRRAILDLLSAADRSVKELAAEFTISQPAISQHLRELRAARLGRYRHLVDPSGHPWAIGAAPAAGARKSRS